MQRFVLLFCVGVSLVLYGGCKARPPQSEYRTTATIKDIMDSMVEPSADFIWDSVETTITFAGAEEKAPTTDEDWLNVRRRAVELVEATNLLLMPDRHVAKPGEKSENAEVELSPDQIETRIKQDRQAWVNFAHALHDAAAPALKASEAKDVQGLLEAGEKIDTACENCHLQYWYPNQKQATAKKP